LSRIVLDTDVASLLFKDQVPASLYERLAGNQLAITFVTVGELAKWSFARSWGMPRRASLDAYVASKARLPGGIGVARKWGEIVAYAERRGRPRPVNDSWIAACCLTYGLPLATLNVTDFQDFADHEGLAIVTA
jgi:toxin FitB